MTTLIIYSIFYTIIQLSYLQKKCVTKEGLEIRMPYYVTQREFNELSPKAKKLTNELNWNKNETI